ncbi:MAG: maleylpyruvate isomerase family mycothiol-dependent enzyme [Acidimicrobiia bacterium]
MSGPVFGIDRIEDLSARLAGLGESGDLGAAVPACPGWSFADLLWHVLEVQDFWAYVIGNRPEPPERYVEPARPLDTELAIGLKNATARLLDALSGADPADVAWSWSKDKTVGFTIRRQTHEALTHMVDGFQSQGRALPELDPELWSDGVGELVTMFFTGVPDWGTFTRTSEALKLETVDTGDEWTIAFGQLVGTSPDSGTVYDTPIAECVPGESPAASISGAAQDLNLWMWGRGDESRLVKSGDAALVAQLRPLIIDATQ